jgi:hypothetical protein
MTVCGLRACPTCGMLPGGSRNRPAKAHTDPKRDDWASRSSQAFAPACAHLAWHVGPPWALLALGYASRRGDAPAGSRIVRVRNGLLTDCWVNSDGHVMTAQLGMTG